MQPESGEKHAAAVEEFNRHEKRGDGARAADGLSSGLTLLKNLLYARLHQDVETIYGRDSMLMPVSEQKTERAAKAEIELFQIAESAAAARDRGYVSSQDEWCLGWLARLRLGEGKADAGVLERLGRYYAQGPEERRRAFSNALAKVLPESGRAPLVLLRLVPLCVQIATALAFGDHRGAEELRRRQAEDLPAIADCRECLGKLLPNGELCLRCGNPLWKSSWLMEAD